MPRYWLSFVDTDAPEGEQFIGWAIVEGNTEQDAIWYSHYIKINPGDCEVALLEIPKEIPNLPQKYMHKLLSKAEAEEVGKLMRASPQDSHAQDEENLPRHPLKESSESRSDTE